MTDEQRQKITEITEQIETSRQILEAGQKMAAQLASDIAELDRERWLLILTV